MLNYKTVKISELGDTIVNNAAELAVILDSTVLDEVIAKTILAIGEVMDRLFVIGHITDPHLLFQRGSHFFESNGLPKESAAEIFEKHVQGNLSPEQIGKTACYVKSKIMALFYAEYLHELRSKLKTLTNSKVKAPLSWNAKNLMISKRQNLHDFLRTTVAPTKATEYFEENFLQYASADWKASYDSNSDGSEKKLILDKSENKKRSSEPMSAHIAEIGKHVLVKTLAEQTHIKNRINNGTQIEREWARQDLNAANSRLVIQSAKKSMGLAVYNSEALEMCDLISEGHVGLNRGILKFNPEKGFKLSTYASWWVKQHISREIDQRAEIIRIPIHLREKINRVYKAKAVLTNELGRMPNEEELAKKVGLPIQKIKQILSYSGKANSLNQPHSEVEDGEDMIDSLTYADNRLMTDDGESNDIGAKLFNAMEQILEPKEARVLKMRYGMPGIHNCRHVSNKSLSEVEEMMSKINHETIDSYEINKIGDQFEIIADDEALPLETLFAKTPEILECSHSTINYRLTFLHSLTARRTAAALRDLQLPEPIQIVYTGVTLTISCPYKNQESILQIRNNLGRFLNDQNKLEIQSRTVININNESLSKKLDHLLNGSAPAGILKAEKTATFDIAVSVIDGMCLEDIGDVYGVTRERIRQMEVKAMRKLRNKEFVKEDGTTMCLQEMFGLDEENNLDVSE